MELRTYSVHQWFSDASFNLLVVDGPSGEVVILSSNRVSSFMYVCIYFYCVGKSYLVLVLNTNIFKGNKFGKKLTQN